MLLLKPQPRGVGSALGELPVLGDDWAALKGNFGASERRVPPNLERLDLQLRFVVGRVNGWQRQRPG